MIIQKFNQNEPSICPKCIHEVVCFARHGKPCTECDAFMDKNYMYAPRCQDCLIDNMIDDGR